MKKKQLTLKRKVKYEELMNRRLLDFYVIIQAITVEMYIGEGNLLEKSKINLMYGMDIHGRKNLIGLYIEEKGNSRYWLEEIEKLKQRGLKKVLYVSTERNKRLEQAFKIVYNPIMKPSINEEVEKIAKYTQYRWRAQGEQELVKAYLSETVEEYDEKMSLLKEKYKDNEIGLMLIREFEKNVRKHIIEENCETRHLVCAYCTKRKVKEVLYRVEKEHEEIKDLEEFTLINQDYFAIFERTRVYSKEKWTRFLNQLYKEKYEEIEEYI